MSTVTFTGTGELTQAIVNSGIGSATIVVISGYSSIGTSAFQECAGLTSVTIGNSVTSIGGTAFQLCSSLTSINIPNSVTTIGQYAFLSCAGLTSITIGTGVTSIGAGAFQSCTSLTSITIGTGVTSIGEGAFLSCTGLASINIPSSVTTIGDYAFLSCTGLASINIPSSVTTIGDYAFYDCTLLVTVYIANNQLTGIPSPSTNVSFFGAIVNTLLPPTPISNICFPAGTLITCNQGNIPIEQLNPNVHTIRNKKIVCVTNTRSVNDYLVCFEKHSLGNNIPSHKTVMTKDHAILFNGKMKTANEFLKNSTGVYKVKYTGETLYNVLMEEHDKMMVNNLICETLNPENPMAKLFTLLQKYPAEQQALLIKEYNDFTIKSNNFSKKQLKQIM